MDGDDDEEGTLAPETLWQALCSDWEAEDVVSDLGLWLAGQERPAAALAADSLRIFCPGRLVGFLGVLDTALRVSSEQVCLESWFPEWLREVCATKAWTENQACRVEEYLVCWTALGFCADRAWALPWRLLPPQAIFHGVSVTPCPFCSAQFFMCDKKSLASLVSWHIVAHIRAEDQAQTLRLSRPSALRACALHETVQRAKFVHGPAAWRRHVRPVSPVPFRDGEVATTVCTVCGDKVHHLYDDGRNCMVWLAAVRTDDGHVVHKDSCAESRGHSTTPRLSL
jgi:hypothetical protein